MARYIDAEELMEKLSRMIDYCTKDNKVNGLTALFQVGDAIMDCPTADVVEVKHGRWQKKGNEKKCSLCKFIYYSNNDEWTFCPNCGAKMDECGKTKTENYYVDKHNITISNS